MTRDALIAKLRNVEGYLSDVEGWALYLAARRCTQQAENPRVVEIGSYKGRSTIAIASGLAESGRGSLVSIDPHKPTGKASYAREHGTLDTLAEFRANLSNAGVERYVTSIQATSGEARRTYDMQPIDMLFVDGSHDYEDVLADIDAWSPLLADGGVAAFNDPYGPGVNRALRERIFAGRLALTAFQHVNNTLFALSDREKSPSFSESFALAAYLYVERLRFKLLKLALKGLFEALGIVYLREAAVRTLGNGSRKIFSSGKDVLE